MGIQIELEAQIWDCLINEEWRIKQNQIFICSKWVGVKDDFCYTAHMEYVNPVI